MAARRRLLSRRDAGVPRATARKALANPELRARIEQLGARPVGNSPAEFSAQIKGEIERMRKLIKERHIKLEE